MKYFRFTNENPEGQITTEQRSGIEYLGVYAWKLDPLDLPPYAGDKEIMQSAYKMACKMANNSQNGYYAESSAGNYVVFEGEKICDGNEGVIARVDRILGWDNVN